MLLISWVKIEKGAWKVCFMDDLLFHKNFGPNVDNNFVDIMDLSKRYHKQMEKRPGDTDGGGVWGAAAGG